MVTQLHINNNRMILKTIKTFSVRDQLLQATWKNTPLGDRAKIMAGIAKEKVGKVASFAVMSAMTIGIGIFDVLHGVKQMNAGFHHDIIRASRGILHETDMILAAYRDLVGVDTDDMNFDVPQELYSVSIKVENPHWDLLSKGYLIFSNGQDPECTTPTFSFSKG